MTHPQIGAHLNEARMMLIFSCFMSLVYTYFRRNYYPNKPMVHTYVKHIKRPKIHVCHLEYSFNIIAALWVCGLHNCFVWNTIKYMFRLHSPVNKATLHIKPRINVLATVHWRVISSLLIHHIVCLARLAAR